jgi:hypothetical protein
MATELPAQVELCQRPLILGRPCLGQLYRPQPGTVYCYACGAHEPGVVYHLATIDERLESLHVAAGALLGTLTRPNPQNATQWTVARGRGRDFSRLVQHLITTLTNQVAPTPGERT